MVGTVHSLGTTVPTDTTSSACLFPPTPGFFGVYLGLVKEIYMRPSSRKSVNKSHSARQFRHASSRTARANLAPGPMRGGIRL